MSTMSKSDLDLLVQLVDDGLGDEGGALQVRHHLLGLDLELTLGSNTNLISGRFQAVIRKICKCLGPDWACKMQTRVGLGLYTVGSGFLLAWVLI
jgi:hypothetical protein